MRIGRLNEEKNQVDWCHFKVGGGLALMYQMWGLFMCTYPNGPPRHWVGGSLHVNVSQNPSISFMAHPLWNTGHPDLEKYTMSIESWIDVGVYRTRPENKKVCVDELQSVFNMDKERFTSMKENCVQYLFSGVLVGAAHPTAYKESLDEGGSLLWVEELQSWVSLCTRYQSGQEVAHAHWMYGPTLLYHWDDDMLNESPAVLGSFHWEELLGKLPLPNIEELETTFKSAHFPPVRAPFDHIYQVKALREQQNLKEHLDAHGPKQEQMNEEDKQVGRI